RRFVRHEILQPRHHMEIDARRFVAGNLRDLQPFDDGTVARIDSGSNSRILASRIQNGSRWRTDYYLAADQVRQLPPVRAEHLPQVHQRITKLISRLAGIRRVGEVGREPALPRLLARSGRSGRGWIEPGRNRYLELGVDRINAVLGRHLLERDVFGGDDVQSDAVVNERCHYT